MSTEARVRRRWTKEEDELLRREAKTQLMQGSLKDWNRIAAKLEGRTNKDCRKRWLKVHKNLKRGPWDSSEDVRLQQGIQLYGFRWTKVANVVKSRHADQCARRWQHSLDPSIDRSIWSEDEDKKLLSAVQRLGHNWTTITENEMPFRSPTDVRNRYILIARKSQRKPESPVSVQEDNSQTCSPSERVVSTESESEGGESEEDEIEEGASYNWASLSPLNSSRASPAPLPKSVQPSTSGHVASTDLNYHDYTVPNSTMGSRTEGSSASVDYGLSAHDQMFPFLGSQPSWDGGIEPSLPSESGAFWEPDWGSYTSTNSNPPGGGYDLFTNPIPNPACSTSVSGHDIAQIMGPATNSPVRTTLTLEASSSALTDVLKTLLETNTKFKIEANH